MVALVHTLGFVLLGGVFVWAGAEHFLKFTTIVAQLAERQFPAPSLLLAAGSTVETVAGLCLATGVARPYAAPALIAFTVAASLMALNFWRYSGPERQGLRSAFTINIAVLGGLILAATADPH
ncbi:DoxX family protein [Mesorhizobium sp. PAMC28654]|uniref:DoxX family protein n=1 Tax=Mesorhizobium sp. PAMC28654 TaxID=2880934 RepID=UPI001D0A877B|nr:DoxX family protein [Mesorhizobium sp. PAMC28654]UDL88879.1 DoxX family protein [Mesorhizobium sp. PAMC28654]